MSKRFALVYQGGIANVFTVDSFSSHAIGRNAKRVYQGDFHTAESIARGAALAGAIVRTLACNQAGDIAAAPWTKDLGEQPFCEKFRPVTYGPGRFALLPLQIQLET